MKHTTFKSNRTDSSERSAELSLLSGLHKIFNGDKRMRYQPQLLHGQDGGRRVFLITIWQQDDINPRLHYGAGVWYATVPARRDAPIKLAWAWRRPSVSPGTEPAIYRPALLPFRLAKLCPDFNPDDPFWGAADFQPVRP